MKKLLFTTLLFVFIFVGASAVLVSSVFAAKDTVNEQKKFENAVFGQKERTNQQKFTDDTTRFFISAMNRQVGSCITEECRNATNGVGAINGVGRMIAFTYKPVASSEEYIADLLQNMNIAQPAYAQGLGFSALQPVLGLWKIFRDIAYVFFVFIFLAIGFAIMFRKNLGGQTAVTVQQALPRVVIALLAVSFSYAIAGLLIDLMWLVMYFLITMFGPLIKPEMLGGSQDQYAILNFNIFTVFSQILSSGFTINAGQTIGDFVNDALGAGEGTVGEIVANAADWLVGQLATLIIFVAILFALFRTFFSLIKVYFEIIMMIIFAPIILMMGAINGNAFGNWVKGLVANLAVFPVLLVFVIVGFMFTSYSSSNLPQQFDEGGFIPPFVPGRDSADTIAFIGGIAAIMLLPEVVSIMGKFKPASIFDEFAPKAINNVMTGNQLAAPALFGTMAGGYGAARGGISAYRNVGGDWRGIIKGMYQGQKVGDQTYGGIKNLAATGWTAGRKTGRVIDRFKSGQGFDPDILTSQFDEFAKKQEALLKQNQGAGGGDHGHTAPTPPSKKSG